MTQNIYDNDAFFTGYSQLERSIHGLDGMAEWPAMRALLPPMAGLSVLDLGCGYGWFCRWAREAGATQVRGTDVSEKMLARARTATQDDAIAYDRADLETIDLPARAYGLIYSSLVFHYLTGFDRLAAQMHRALAPGGRLVFSVEHPVFAAPSNPGWVDGPDGRKVWPVDRYLDEGPRTTDWLAKGVVKQHRTIGSYANLLIAAGFTLTRIEEWGPTPEQVAARPDWAIERDRPPFLLIAATR